MGALKQGRWISDLAKLLLLGWLMGCSMAWAQTKSPVGVWKYYEDEQVRGVFETWIDKSGRLNAKVVRWFFRAGETPRRTCVGCLGSRAGKKITGLHFLWGLKGKGLNWSGGEMLDPMSGFIFNCRAKLNEQGNLLTIHYYWGLSALGKTIEWYRVK